MQELTALLLPYAEQMDDWFTDGASDAYCIHHRQVGWRKRLKTVNDLYRYYGHIRHRWGFVDKGAPLLSLPGYNQKLDKSETVTVGLTLSQYATRLPKVIHEGRVTRKQITVNACPHAGDCIAVCVLNNGHGNDPRVIKARKAKTDFLVSSPAAFSYLLGYELQRAALKYGVILFRPNVASDVCWEKLLPSLTGGYIQNLTGYGYSKWPYVLDTIDGWLDTHYRVAYSWNEDSDPVAAWRFLERGGNVAMVTSRKKGDFTPRQVHMPGADHLFINHYRHVDADLTDEWILAGRGVIGDLSAKGRARSLIGKSNFVVCA